MAHEAGIIRGYCRNARVLKAGRGRAFDDLDLALSICETRCAS